MEKKKVQNLYRKKVPVLLAFALLGSGLAGCQNKEAQENQQAYRQLGINKLGEGSYEEAAEAFQKALDQSEAVVGEMEIDICYYKATAQYKAGDTEGALTTCKALVDYDKDNEKAYFLRGCIYLKEEKREQAMEDYQKAFETSGDDFALYVSAYENLKNAGWDAEAEEVLEAAAKLKADKAEEHRELGRIYLLQEDYDNARKELDLAINQEDVKALLYMAQVYEAEGDTAQADALYESYISKNNSDVSTLAAMGDAQMQAGNYEEALGFYQQALSVENLPNEQQLRRNEIIACEQMLDFEAAKEKMVAYRKDFPEDADAEREYIFLQTR